jgi:hypothetical protein
MPRETVYGPLQGDNPPCNPPVISVGWGREAGYVRIGTGKDHAAGLDGWFVDVDRAAINRLIRLLRKARDQAYGSDA